MTLTPKGEGLMSPVKTAANSVRSGHFHPSGIMNDITNCFTLHRSGSIPVQDRSHLCTDESRNGCVTVCCVRHCARGRYTVLSPPHEASRPQRPQPTNSSMRIPNYSPSVSSLLNQGTSRFSAGFWPIGCIGARVMGTHWFLPTHEWLAGVNSVCN